MRIAYLIYIGDMQTTGVLEKIRAQIKAWRNMENEVRLYAISNNQEFIHRLKASFLADEVSIFDYRNSTLPAYSYFTERIRLLSIAADQISHWKPDIVYMREDHYSPPIIKIARNYPLIIEVNGNLLLQAWDSSKAKWIYAYATRGFYFKKASGLCFESNELAATPLFSRFNKDYIVIGNGIELERRAAIKTTEKDETRLVFMGTDAHTWHGIDKIYYLAKECSDWTFDFIGMLPEDIKFNAPDNIIFHGSMNNDEYAPILEKADCALGTLALHRKKYHEVSPLKTREYLRFGLPVIIGYQDTDFPYGADFLLQLPNTKDNIIDNIERIRCFVESWKGKRVQIEEISHLDINVKEALRVRFFQACIDKFRNR